MGAGTRREEEQLSPGGRGRRSSGSAVVEFALVALLFLSIIFVSFNFFFWVFTKAALHSAVREGARYAITGQTTGSHQDASIRQVVRNNAFGLLNSAPDSAITVEYFAVDGSGSTTSNAAGNIIVVSVLNFTPATIAPLFGFRYPISLNVRAVDKVEPFSGTPQPR
jgi:Flp pilus assembly protein TadG